MPNYCRHFRWAVRFDLSPMVFKDSHGCDQETFTRFDEILSFSCTKELREQMESDVWRHRVRPYIYSWQGPVIGGVRRQDNMEFHRGAKEWHNDVTWVNEMSTERFNFVNPAP